MQKIFIRTSVDLLLICFPLLILFFILVLEGVPGNEIWHKPEWSFISILLIADSFKDFGRVWRHAGEHEEQIESGYAFMAMFMVVSAFILAIDFRHSIGKSFIESNAVYYAKFIWFSACVVLFAVTRWKRHAI